MYNLHIKPLIDKSQHYYEVFDDTTILVSISFLFMFSQAVENSDDKYKGA
jgi:hypothetical protein